jgi:ribosomal subunit interface protein
MKILIHSRGFNLAADFKTIAEERINRLTRFNIQIDEIDLEVTRETNPRFGKTSHKVVITSHGSGPLIRAQAYGINDLAAFDLAAEAVEQQLRKKHERAKEIDRSTLRKQKS